MPEIYMGDLSQVKLFDILKPLLTGKKTGRMAFKGREAEDGIRRRDQFPDPFHLLFPVGPLEEQLFRGGGDGSFSGGGIGFEGDPPRFQFHDQKKGRFAGELEGF